MMASPKHIQLLLLTVLLMFNLLGFSQKTKRIEIIHANSIEFSEKIGKDIKRLLGDVQFKHEDAIMYCDSAYLNSKTNFLQAFNNVHIIQADSLDLFGDYLNYDGNQKIAKVRKNVKMIHGTSVLKTDSLDYDRKTNIAHYFSWGYLNDVDNDLESVHGYYYADFKDYYAVDSVLLTTPDYTIESDSLRYNTGSDIAYFYGPTDIVSDSNYIYCEYGWYNTKTDIAQVSKQAFIHSKEKRLYGDSIYYDRNLGFGNAIQNVFLQDTSAQVLISGHYANYFEHRDSAYVTQQALMTKYGDGDSLFLHADTLRFYTVFDTIWSDAYIYKDSILPEMYHQPFFEYDNMLDNMPLPLVQYPDTGNVGDSIPSIRVVTDTVKNYTFDTLRIFTAFRHAQIFKDDLQARCDSMSYSTKDSTFRMYQSPIIWSDEQQITANHIEMLTANNKPTEMWMKQSAFIALKDDSIRYNQVKGMDMKAYFNDKQELYRLDVYNNAQSVFFPREEANEAQKRDSIKGDLVGANLTESTKMVIWFEDNQPNKITLYTKPKGVLNPKEYKPIEELILDGFDWKYDLRPKSKAEVFVWKKSKEASEEQEAQEAQQSTSPQTLKLLPKTDKKTDENIEP